MNIMTMMRKQWLEPSEQLASPTSVTKSRLNAELSERLISLNSGGNVRSGIEPASDELTWRGRGGWCKVNK